MRARSPRGGWPGFNGDISLGYNGAIWRPRIEEVPTVYPKIAMFIGDKWWSSFFELGYPIFRHSHSRKWERRHWSLQACCFLSKRKLLIFRWRMDNQWPFTRKVPISQVSTQEVTCWHEKRGRLQWKSQGVAPVMLVLEPNSSSVNQVKQFTDRSKMDRWSKARLSNYGLATTAQQPTLLSLQQPRLSNQPYSRFSNHGSATTGDGYDWKSYFII